MLDTIALTLEQHQFEILAPERFSPSAIGVLRPPYYPLGARAYFSCVLNPSKSDLAGGRYAPRLTLGRRKNHGGFVTTLRIEFSAPKLLFGNNFDELCSRDFEDVLATLHGHLTECGVRVTGPILRAAHASAVHYGKNIAFTDFTSCSMVMHELDLIDLSGRFDLSQTDYRNEGHAIRYHTNDFELTFYDKLKDLQRATISDKRSVERDTVVQRDLFRDRGAYLKELEVLRMEVRLGSRRRITSLLKKLEIEIEPTFAALFDQSVAKEILLHFWNSVRRQIAVAPSPSEPSPEALFARLAMAGAGKTRPGKLLQMLGGVVLVRSVGYRGAAALLQRHCSARSWQRYKRELKQLPAQAEPSFTALRRVDESLAVFETLRLDNYRVRSVPCNVESSRAGGPSVIRATRTRKSRES
jgi:hypothetical protein